MDGATAFVTKIGGFTSTKICIEPGFDWAKSVGSKMPGCPKSCSANHFGYLSSGSMLMKMDDGSEVLVNEGDTYHIPPGHVPVVQGTKPAVMIEFSQESEKMLENAK